MPVSRSDADPPELIECPPDHPDVARLLRAFYDDQVSRYGYAEPIDLDAREYVPPNGGFVVACQAGQPVGCGGWHWHDSPARVAELKKAYVVPAARGQGAGRAVLSWLEQNATQAGAVQAIVESGARNTAALALLASHGYQPIDPYVPGRNPAINRAFTRPLGVSQT